mgnify:CR=1 FL=1
MLFFGIMKERFIATFNQKLMIHSWQRQVGCTLMNKTLQALENIEGSKQSLVIEPFANPFRVYPLVEDYQKFRSLFASGVDCYIINTGFYMGNGIPKEVSLDIIRKNC